MVTVVVEWKLEAKATVSLQLNVLLSVHLLNNQPVIQTPGAAFAACTAQSINV